MHQTGRSQKRTNKWFAGMPKDFFQGNPKKNSGTENAKKNSRNPFRNPKKIAGFRNLVLFFRKRVAKDIDPTRVKRIKLTNKDKIRLRLEKNNYFHRKVIRVSSASSKRLS